MGIPIHVQFSELPVCLISRELAHTRKEEASHEPKESTKKVTSSPVVVVVVVATARFGWNNWHFERITTTVLSADDRVLPRQFFCLFFFLFPLLIILEVVHPRRGAR